MSRHANEWVQEDSRAQASERSGARAATTTRCDSEAGTVASPAEKVAAEIQQERQRQDAKWGEQNHVPCIWMTILGEEFGEACQAALEMWSSGRLTAAEYRKELIQIAAVAQAAVECLDRDKWRG